MIFVDLVPHELLTAKGILLVFKAETANRGVSLYKVKQHSGWLVSRNGPIVFIFLNNIISWGVFLYIFEIL